MLLSLGRSQTTLDMKLDYLTFLVAESAAEKSFDFSHTVEELLAKTALNLKIGIECLALFVLAVGVIKAIVRLFARSKIVRRPITLCSIRRDLGKSLMLSLEFLLAADIAATAISPSWEVIGQLSAISGIRTFLNYFLQKEVQELEHSTSPKPN